MYVSARNPAAQTTYISSSTIQGQGLFANRSFSEGDLILVNLFPHKDPDEVLYKPVTKEKFMYYMGDKTSRLNHCSNQDNAQVITSDNKIYQLVSTQDISRGSEITVNYDKTNKEYPFIGGANNKYIKC